LCIGGWPYHWVTENIDGSHDYVDDDDDTDEHDDELGDYNIAGIESV